MRPRNFLILGAIGAGALLGGLLGDRVLATDDDQRKAFDRFARSVDLIEQNYAEPVDTEDLVAGAIRGMLHTLDPHSNYLDPKTYRQMRDEQRGSFSGLGIVVTKKGDSLTVISPIEDTPAYRLGIRGGDVISKIEGEATREMSLDLAVSKLKGPKGTKVTITMTRPGVEPFDLTITRDDIPTKSVPKPFLISQKDGIGYLRLKSFTQTSSDEVDEAIHQLQAQGMKALLFDLRNNPGGLLDQAVKVANKFVDKGQLIVYTQGRVPDSHQRFVATAPPAGDFPLVVLVNQYSASASEIVAGAIQDHDRALIAGETTWGKGLVQSVFPLKYNAGLALTTAKYYTPSGRCIQRDYKESFEDYFDYDGDEKRLPPRDETQKHATDLSRVVYGGGGITPDVRIPPRVPSPFEERLYRADTFFKFAVSYLSTARGEVSHQFEPDDKAMAAFKKFLGDEKVEFTEDEWKANLDQVKGHVAEYVVSNAYGLDEGTRVRIATDPQVAEALKLFPRATELASLAHKKLKGGPDVSPETPAGAQAEINKQ